MNRKVLLVLGVILLSTPSFGTEWSFNQNNHNQFRDLTNAPDPRLFNISTGSFVTFNETLILFTGGVILWSIAGALLLYYLITIPADATYDYDYGGGYSRHSEGRSFDPHSMDWETFSILDWIEVADETWRKFDPRSLDCQKRLICELHQNAANFGFFAKRLVDAFSFLEYTEVLRLPESVKSLLDEYQDAAAQGRSMKRKCGEIYTGCEYSMKKAMEHVSLNEI